MRECGELLPATAGSQGQERRGREREKKKEPRVPGKGHKKKLKGSQRSIGAPAFPPLPSAFSLSSRSQARASNVNSSLVRLERAREALTRGLARVDRRLFREAPSELAEAKRFFSSPLASHSKALSACSRRARQSPRALGQARDGPQEAGLRSATAEEEQARARSTEESATAGAELEADSENCSASSRCSRWPRSAAPPSAAGRSCRRKLSTASWVKCITEKRQPRRWRLRPKRRCCRKASR